MRLTDPAEQALVTEFIRAMVTGRSIGNRQVENMTEIDAWAEAEITEAKLQPLMEGEIVTSHPGTDDGQWQCAYEFTAPGHDRISTGTSGTCWALQSGAIFDADAPVIAQGSDSRHAASRAARTPRGTCVPVPGSFQLLDLLPKPDLSTMGCTFDLSGIPVGIPAAVRQMTGLPLISPGGGRMVSLATVLRVIFRRALVHTSDTRLLPSGGISWSSSDLALGEGPRRGCPSSCCA